MKMYSLGHMYQDYIFSKLLNSGFLFGVRIVVIMGNKIHTNVCRILWNKSYELLCTTRGWSGSFCCEAEIWQTASVRIIAWKWGKWMLSCESLNNWFTILSFGYGDMFKKNKLRVITITLVFTKTSPCTIKA